jgi:hypothetical protein
MRLKLRPTGLGFRTDKDRPNYTVFTGEWEIGRIFETRWPAGTFMMVLVAHY